MAKRVFVSFPITDVRQIKLQVLNWASRFNTCCFLDSHEYALSGDNSLECLCAVDAVDYVQADAGTAFEQLKRYVAHKNDWLFGHFGYDLKNETERLRSLHPDAIDFPDLFFFTPRILVLIGRGSIDIGLLEGSHDDVWNDICRPLGWKTNKENKIMSWRQRFTRPQYLQTIQQLQAHLMRGDCYEINFCQEFYATPAALDPVLAYQRLSDLSPAPFGAFYKWADRYLLCASPERYLRRLGDDLLSQPIKGTSPRDLLNSDSDKKYRQQLADSPKEKSENVIVVDLVRNDLAKVCTPGTIKVQELQGIYGFAQVHQMMSSVTGQYLRSRPWVDAIQASFPMGSMTGAPKKKVMELIEQYERTKRGIFSGALGYVSPEGDFDFNVVIRSICYNQQTRYVGYQVGSAVTVYSDPEQEYEECLLKGAAIKKVLAG